MSLRRKIFYGFTLAALLLVVVLPATGWLVRLQLIPVHSQGTTGMNYIASMNTNSAAIDAAFHRIAADHPSDFPIQYGTAVYPSDSETQITRLTELQERFPDHAIIPAALIRMMCSQLIKIDRPEQDILSPPREGGTEPSTKKQEAINPADLARFDTVAARGESLEPNNGFFPAMRAVGYYAAHKDAEAIDAWKRAAGKQEWNDHVQDEIAARTHLLQTLNNGSEIGFLLRTVSFSNILFPNYARLRAAARMATAKAVQAELSGNSEEGFALRRATRLIGEKMADQKGTVISNLVGVAITKISQSRPGGAPETKNPEHGPDASKHFQQKKRTEYIAYLNKIGHPEEAVAFQSTIKQGDKIRAITSTGITQSYVGFSKNTMGLLLCWFADGLLTMGVLFSLVFAAIFGLIFRFSPRLQKGEPLQSSARWGVTLAILASITLLALSIFSDSISSSLWWLFGGAVVCGFIIPPFFLRLTARQFGHGVLVCLITVVCIGVLCGVVSLSGGLFRGVMMTLGLMGIGEERSQIETPGGTAMIAMLISNAMILLPILMLCLFALFSRVLRIPVASGVTRGMRAMGVPLACVLVFGYIGCLLITWRHENAAIAEMKRRDAVGELQMYTELARASKD